MQQPYFIDFDKLQGLDKITAKMSFFDNQGD
jgi:hypothetical protein